VIGRDQDGRLPRIVRHCSSTSCPSVAVDRAGPDRSIPFRTRRSSSTSAMTCASCPRRCSVSPCPSSSAMTRGGRRARQRDAPPPRRRDVDHEHRTEPADVEGAAPGRAVSTAIRQWRNPGL